MIMSGNEAWNRKKRWRKVDRDGADITLSGRLFQVVELQPINVVTLTRLTNNASRNWVNLFQVSSSAVNALESCFIVVQETYVSRIRMCNYVYCSQLWFFPYSSLIFLLFSVVVYYHYPHHWYRTHLLMCGYVHYDFHRVTSKPFISGENCLKYPA